MNTTPNTPANGGQILTDERIVEIAERVDSRVFHADWYREFARAIEADLRAALAAPAIPTVDRNAALEEAAQVVIERSGAHYRDKNFAMQDECLGIACALRDCKSAAPSSAQAPDTPAAPTGPNDSTYYT